jgi:flagellar hook-associated protein 3 FlgL
MQTNLQRLMKLQKQAVTSKKLNQPGDDPFAVEQALGFRNVINQIEASRQSVSAASDWLAATDNALSQLGELSLRAEELALRGASDSLGAEGRQALATELEEIIEEGIAIGNTRHGDDYLFSGFKVMTAPFEAVRDPVSGLVTSTIYNGDQGSLIREVEPGANMTINVLGDPLFSDIIDSLIDLRNNLQSPSVSATDIGGSLDEIRLQKDKNFDSQAVLGTKARRLQSIASRLETMEIGFRELLSKAEDADMAEVITQLNQQQFVYQTALSVNAQSLKTSLLDFLR